MVKKGLTAIIEFDIAHFRVHTTMKGRTTYILPLPSTIIGFFFSILGKSREEYVKEGANFLAGAKILNLRGVCRENAQLLKLKPNKETLTTEEVMLILKPKYKFAIWGNEEIIQEIYERIKTYNFHFVPYGGINDFIFWDIKEPKLFLSYSKSEKIESSYAPLEIVDSSQLANGGILYSLPYLSEGIPKRVVMCYGISLKLSQEVPVLEEVPLYKLPLEVISE